MKPRFFQFDHNAFRNRHFPWAPGVYAAGSVPHGRRCAGCGRQQRRYEGVATARVEDYEDDAFGRVPATHWPDVIGSGNGVPFMVSQRVVETLQGAGSTGVLAYPVVIEEVKSLTLQKGARPRYYYVQGAGTIDIDMDACGFKGPRCSVCRGSIEALDQAVRRVPKPETWSGHDLFMMQNHPTNQVLCTEKVLLLARENRWSNFRFLPMDAVIEHTFSWPGIDYLGEQWPPEKWYPDPPAAGRTLDEWLEALKDDDVDISYKATLALLEIGEPAVPGLVKLFLEDERFRYESANILKGLNYRGVPVPPEVMPAVEHEMRDG